MILLKKRGFVNSFYRYFLLDYDIIYYFITIIIKKNNKRLNFYYLTTCFALAWMYPEYEAPRYEESALAPLIHRYTLYVCDVEFI